MGTRKLAAGFVIVRRDPDTCRFLLLRAFRYWDFPKGEVEPSESAWDTARREVWEETRITRLWFPWGQTYRETPPYHGGKVARYYLAETDVDAVTLPVNPELGRPEHHAYRWCTYAEAHARLGTRVASVLSWAARVSGCIDGDGS